MPKQGKENRESRIRIGIGGWTYEPWRGSFYPEGLTQKRELEYASRHMTSIEINGTYYGSQKPESFARWHDETPDDFVFAVKGPRYATNRRVLAEAGASIERFLTGGVLELEDKLGPINWQFMPTKKFDPEDFEAFLRLLPTSVEGRSIRHAVEVRHDSFRAPEFIALAKEYGVAIIIAADSDYPQIADVTAPFVYVRLMGSTEEESAGYSPGALDAWTKRARTWAMGEEADDLKTLGVQKKAAKPKPRDVFVYFISGYKERNPAAAMEMLKRLR